MGFFGKITSIALNTITLPIDVVKDIATCGGALTNDNMELDPSTLKKCKKIQETINSLAEEE